MYHIIIHSSTDGHVGCFHFLAVVNSAAINIGVHLSFTKRAALFFGSIPRSGVAGSNGIPTLSFLRNLRIAFHNGWTNLRSHQQCRRVPLSPQPCQHLLCFVVWMVAILTGVWWYLIVVLISISLMTGDVVHLFMCLLGTWISSLANCLFSSPAHIFIAIFPFCLLRCFSSLYILDVNPLSDLSFRNIFSHTGGCPFVLLMVPFTVE